jgi:hypothetical protein
LPLSGIGKLTFIGAHMVTPSVGLLNTLKINLVADIAIVEEVANQAGTAKESHRLLEVGKLLRDTINVIETALIELR